MTVKILARFARRLHGPTRPIFLTCIYGVVAGFGAVAFQLAISAFHHFTLAQFSHASREKFLLGSLSVIVTTSLLVGFLLNHFCREASGSGIPQLKIAFWKDFGFVPLRVVWVKFVAGVLSIGGGCSLGREGPSVQIAGGLGSNLAGIFGEPKQNRRLASAAGAAAGLAAAFNTPLAAVMFVLEEIIEDLNSRLLGSVLLASVIGAFVVHGLIGKQPAFTLSGVESPAWLVYCLTPLVAGVAAVVGAIFQKATIRLRARRKEFAHVPAWIRPALGGVVTWVLGSIVFLETSHLGIFGLGYDDLSAGLSLHLTWQIAAVLLVCKLFATIACYGLGGCGGIFSPTLFFGGMCGISMAKLFALLFPLSTADQIALSVVAMSACLGAVVRAPVTGILMVFEMTHEFSLVPALMLGALVSQAVSRKLNALSFYDALLAQDGHNLEHMIPPRDLHSWQQFPVSAIANFQPIIVEDITPDGLQRILKSYPYQRFPVVLEEKLIGVITRGEAIKALAENRPPAFEPFIICLPSQTVAELQGLLIESTTFFVVLMDRANSRVLGLITLHDLLRAEASVAKEQSLT